VPAVPTKPGNALPQSTFAATRATSPEERHLTDQASLRPIATKPEPPASHAGPEHAVTTAGTPPHRPEISHAWPRQATPGSLVPHVAPLQVPPCIFDTSRCHSAWRGRAGSVPPITSPDRTTDPEVVSAHLQPRRGRHHSGRPGLSQSDR